MQHTKSLKDEVLALIKKHSKNPSDADFFLAMHLALYLEEFEEHLKSKGGDVNANQETG